MFICTNTLTTQYFDRNPVGDYKNLKMPWVIVVTFMANTLQRVYLYQYTSNKTTDTLGDYTNFKMSWVIGYHFYGKRPYRMLYQHK